MIAQRVPLSKLHIVDELPSPLKRKAKIFASKLPQDFFARRTPLQTERLTTNSCRNQIQTQDFSRNPPASDRVSETRETPLRGELSLRHRKDEGNTMNLFMGIISSTRDIRKSIRKHSLELRKDCKLLSNIENMKVELPPLFLKKGVTANF